MVRGANASLECDLFVGLPMYPQVALTLMLDQGVKEPSRQYMYCETGPARVK